MDQSLCWLVSCIVLCKKKCSLRGCDMLYYYWWFCAWFHRQLSAGYPLPLPCRRPHFTILSPSPLLPNLLVCLTGKRNSFSPPWPHPVPSPLVPFTSVLPYAHSIPLFNPSSTHPELGLWVVSTSCHGAKHSNVSGFFPIHVFALRGRCQEMVSLGPLGVCACFLKRLYTEVELVDIPTDPCALLLHMHHSHVNWDLSVVGSAFL